MDFLIADTFTDSLARLTGEEQKAVKTTAFDLQMNLATPGLSLHKLDRARDKRFWSARVSGDIRLIVHRGESSLLLCYVDHHDKAYDWAERRKLEVHPSTGAAQLVEIRETVKEIVIPLFVPRSLEPRPATVPTTVAIEAPLFRDRSDQELLGYGIPTEWLAEARSATNDSLLALVDHLPAEAAEALLELATGGTPRVATPAEITGDPFEHPDAQRRFRVMANAEELQQALEFPWERWTIFLHPAQRQLVERKYSGPARVSGSAGTGKTIVALHRAVHLVRSDEDSRVLLTTFSDTLASAIRTKVRRLIASQPRLGDRIDVLSLDAIADRLYRAHVGSVRLAQSDEVRTLIKAISTTVPGHKFTNQFLIAEWEEVVDAWQLASWEQYRDVARLGRKTRLPEPQRMVLWSIFERVQAELDARGVVTRACMLDALSKRLAAAGTRIFEHVVADEAQDLSVAHLRFLAALGGERPDGLFFAGDLGQRIFQQPFSWKSIGVDIRGRSRTLRVNYRTSHQIRTQADRLLGSESSDVDGIIDRRDDTISVFSGPEPAIRSFPTHGDEQAAVAQWLGERIAEGLKAHELGVFVRSERELPRARSAVQLARLPCKELNHHVDLPSGHAAISTMHLAKGLEFRAVVVMACDDEIIPSQERIEAVGDEADLREVYETERHLLYVACTRARDQLMVSCVEPGSEFLDDLRSEALSPQRQK